MRVWRAKAVPLPGVLRAAGGFARCSPARSMLCDGRGGPDGGAFAGLAAGAVALSMLWTAAHRWMVTMSPR